MLFCSSSIHSLVIIVIIILKCCKLACNNWTTHESKRIITLCCVYMIYINTRIYAGCVAECAARLLHLLRFYQSTVANSSRECVCFIPHFYEDARGVIARNIDQITQYSSPVEFIPPFAPPSSPTSNAASRVFYSTVPPQASCPCGSRQEHCSTASDSCSPLVLTPGEERGGNSEVVYMYQQLWQYLAFDDYVSADVDVDMLANITTF